MFLGGAGLAIAGAVVWGLGMGWQESIMRSVVADLTPKERRGSAFGVFNMGYGVFWFAGSALIGLLYSRSVMAVVIFSVAAQLIAVPFYAYLAARPTGAASPRPTSPGGGTASRRAGGTGRRG